MDRIVVIVLEALTIVGALAGAYLVYLGIFIEPNPSMALAQFAGAIALVVVPLALATVAHRQEARNRESRP